VQCKGSQCDITIVLGVLSVASGSAASTVTLNQRLLLLLLLLLLLTDDWRKMLRAV